MKEVSKENDESLSILDVGDANDPVNVFRAINSLQTNRNKIGGSDIEIVFSNKIKNLVDVLLEDTRIADLLQTAGDKDFFRSFLTKHSMISMVNGHKIGFCAVDEVNSNAMGYKIASGNGIFPFLSLLNHSCGSNVSRMSSNRSYHLVVVRTIHPGEQIFDRYCCEFQVHNFDLRQTRLRESFKFDCKCERQEISIAGFSSSASQ